MALFSNPKGGRNLRNMPEVRRIAAGYPNVKAFEATLGKDIRAELAAIAVARPQVLVINAGDGTIHTLLTAMHETRAFETLPMLALISGGSTNMDTGDVGPRRRQLPSLRRLLNWCREPVPAQASISTRCVMRFSPGAGHPPSYGMFFGAGLVTKGVQHHHDNMHRAGMRHGFGSAISTARMLWAMARRDPNLIRPLRADLGVNGEACQPIELMLLFASTLNRLLHGFRPFWNDAIDGGLHCTHIEYKPRHPLRVIPHLLLGKTHAQRTAANGYHSSRIQRLEIHMDGVYTLDGETHEAKRADGPMIITPAQRMAFLRIHA